MIANSLRQILTNKLKRKIIYNKVNNEIFKILNIK